MQSATIRWAKYVNQRASLPQQIRRARERPSGILQALKGLAATNLQEDADRIIAILQNWLKKEGTGTVEALLPKTARGETFTVEELFVTASLLACMFRFEIEGEAKEVEPGVWQFNHSLNQEHRAPG